MSLTETDRPKRPRRADSSPIWNRQSSLATDSMYVVPSDRLARTDRWQNPLSFSIPADVAGDLGEAMQTVSDEIVSASESRQRIAHVAS